MIMKRVWLIFKVILIMAFVFATLYALLLVWPSNYPKSDEQLRQSTQREYQLPSKDNR